MLRKRMVVKLFIGIPILWIAVMLIVSITDSNNSNNNTNKNNEAPEVAINQLKQLAREAGKQDKQKIQDLIKQNADLKIEKKEAVNQNRHENKHIEDKDHPEEERAKAEEQQKGAAQPIQVHAPHKPHLDSSAPGELGRPVEIDKDKLSPEERKKYDAGWKNNAFNNYASDMISIHRTLADIRDPECKKMEFLPNLPTTSVIIIFHNEAWSVLLRTIHSVLDRTDPKLLKEIIVVDDCSDFAHLLAPLQEYIDSLEKKVVLARTKKREGLIRARLKGAEMATGEVLVFLDSHCETAEGWLEPLIDPIARNPNVSTVPLIEIIDDNTFKMYSTPIESVQVGGFDWNLIFDWHPVPKREMARRSKKTDPIRSPTMAGGLFAINRKYFELLGSYDPGMEIWGGENLEISFKLWMCGGELLCAPCSHVGHIFRKRSPYKWPSNVNVVRKNTVRLAEVWLDEYKNYYYERLQNNLGNYGDVSERKTLRKNLQCKSFDWYIKNVFPEQFVPGESLFFGEIRSGTGTACLDSNGDTIGKAIIGYVCHGQGGNQYWMMSKLGEIRRDEHCFDYSGGRSQLGKKNHIFTYNCHGQAGNQKWIHETETNLIKHESGFCLEVLEDRISIVMQQCDMTNERQLWKWKTREQHNNQKQLAIAH